MGRKEKHKGSKKRLELQNLWKELSTEDLTWLIMNSEQEPIQRKAWKKLKARGELTLSDIYDLTYGPEFIQDELLEMFLREAAPEALLEAIYWIPSFFESAEKKLFSLIKRKMLGKGQAKYILTKIIERIPPSRQKAFLLFIELNPSQPELLKIHDMEFIESDPAMQTIVEKLIRAIVKKNEKSNENKKIKKIVKLEERLQKNKKKKLKKLKKG